MNTYIKFIVFKMNINFLSEIKLDKSKANNLINKSKIKFQVNEDNINLF